MTVRDEKHLVLDKVFAHIFESITPDMNQEVNLLDFSAVHTVVLEL